MKAKTTQPNASGAGEVSPEGNLAEKDERVERKSVVDEITILFVRTAKDILRNKELATLQLVVSILLALFIGGIFNGVTNDLAGFQNRMGVRFTESLFWERAH